jgi:hypothetical protein
MEVEAEERKKKKALAGIENNIIKMMGILS